jgi:hypothetical protein
MCSRNDRVEKVTAIISSHTQKVTQTEQRVEEIAGDQGQRRLRTVEVPVTRTQMSDLASRLAPPEVRSPVPMPQKPSSGGLLTFGIVLVAMAVLFGVPGAICTLFASGEPAADTTEVVAGILATSVVCVLPLVLVLGVGVGLILWGRKRRQASWEKYEVELAEAQAVNERARQVWNRARARWESLYYCHRDDCVFIPNKGTCAPLTQMREYLYRG